MALLDELNLNAPDANPDEVERQFAPLAEGLHHACLNGYREFTANSGAKGHELTFLILAGPGKGREVKESIWRPDGQDAEKDKKKTDKLRMWSHRLGLLKKVTEGKASKYVPVEGKTEFSHAIGTEVLIDVQLEDDEYLNNQGKTVKTKRLRLSYEGVIPLDDKRGEKVPRGKKPEAGTSAAPAAASPPPAKSGRDFGDI